MRISLTIALLVAGIAVARAMNSADQIIIFGGQSSASGSAGCTNKLDFTVVCNSQYLLIGPLR